MDEKNIYVMLWDVITHLCINFNAGLIKFSLMELTFGRG